MYPEPSVSNSSKASLISCFCTSVNSGLGAVFLRGGGTGPCRDGLLATVAWWWGHRRKNIKYCIQNVFFPIPLITTAGLQVIPVRCHTRKRNYVITRWWNMFTHHQLLYVYLANLAADLLGQSLFSSGLWRCHFGKGKTTKRFPVYITALMTPSVGEICYTVKRRAYLAVTAYLLKCGWKKKSAANQLVSRSGCLICLPFVPADKPVVPGRGGAKERMHWGTTRSRNQTQQSGKKLIGWWKSRGSLR